MRIDRLLPLLGIIFISGCGGMQISDFEGRQPELKLEHYFAGKTWGWGIFEDRFGNLRREFVVEIDGHWDGRTLTLDEHFNYSDGDQDRRIWTIEALPSKRYLGRADDVIGAAHGQVAGNALFWSYKIDLPVGDSLWRVRFDDWMFLQPGGVLINRADVSRWGFRIGTLTLFFSKQPPAPDSIALTHTEAANSAQ